MTEVSEVELTAIKLIDAYGGIMNGRSVNFPIGRCFAKGLLTFIKVSYNGTTTVITEKSVWWNRKKETMEFTKELRAKCVDLYSVRQGHDSRYYYAITPLGIEALARSREQK